MERPPTTAPHDLELRLVQRAGPVTTNMLDMLTCAACGYADGPCKGLVGRIVLQGLRDTTGLRPRAFEAELDRLAAHLRTAIAPFGAGVAVELNPQPGDCALLITPLDN